MRSTNCSPLSSNCSKAISLELFPLPVNHSFTRMQPHVPEMVKMLGDAALSGEMEQPTCATPPLGSFKMQLMAASISGFSLDICAVALPTLGSSPARARTIATPWMPRLIKAPALEHRSFPWRPWPTGRLRSMFSTTPTLPCTIISRTRLVTGWLVGWVPSSSTRPASSAARCATRASRELRVIGVSLSTCLPAVNARTVQSARTATGRTL
mmetsp:Transcript_53930/g.163854  ORF Transcript_53930/g.163854 Transcript_53930/m.163854 type:complete len:211 (+) Transcript_53930:337-969(+)